MDIIAFDNALDFITQSQIADLYDGVYPIGPVLHQILTGIAGMYLYCARADDGRLLGAGVLKSSEIVMPAGPEVKPLGWIVSDMVTPERFRRKGVARRLLAHIEQVAYRNGGRILYLYTDEQNGPAVQLYRNCRYRQLEGQSGQAVFVKLLGVADGAN
jgi:GNAT superfamily N-acetyltransferase